MWEGRRLAYFFVAWIFLGSLVVQVFLAGLTIFESADWGDIHGTFGYIVVHPIGLILIVVALLAKLPRPMLILAIVAPVLSFFMPIFAGPSFRANYAFYAALHPTLAVILFGLATVLVVGARELVPRPWGKAEQDEG